MNTQVTKDQVARWGLTTDEERTLRADSYIEARWWLRVPLRIAPLPTITVILCAIVVMRMFKEVKE